LVAATSGAALAERRWRCRDLAGLGSDGAGVDELRARLAAEAIHTPYRLMLLPAAVDRVFPLAWRRRRGPRHVLSGTLHVGDRVLVSPRAYGAGTLAARPEPAAEIGRAGDRCRPQSGEQGISKDAIRRGDMVLDPACMRDRPYRCQAAVIAAKRSRSAHGFRCGCITPRPRRRAPSSCSMTSRSGRAHRPTSSCARAADRRRRAGQLRHSGCVGAAHAGGGRFSICAPPTGGGDAGTAGAAQRHGHRRSQAGVCRPAGYAAVCLGRLVFCRDRALPATQAAAARRGTWVVVLESGAARIAISPEHWQSFTASLLEQLGPIMPKARICRASARKAAATAAAAPAGAGVPRCPGEDGSQRELVLDGAFVGWPRTSCAWREGRGRPGPKSAQRVGGAERFGRRSVRDIRRHDGEAGRRRAAVALLAGRMGWATKWRTTISSAADGARDGDPPRRGGGAR